MLDPTYKIIISAAEVAWLMLHHVWNGLSYSISGMAYIVPCMERIELQQKWHGLYCTSVWNTMS